MVLLFSSRRRHTRLQGDWSSDVCSSDLPEDALRWRKRDPEFVPAGGGESLLMLRDRISATVNRLASGHPGEQIVIVAHGGVMDVLYRLATHQEVQAPRTWALGNAAINQIGRASCRERV